VAERLRWRSGCGGGAVAVAERLRWRSGGRERVPARVRRSRDSGKGRRALPVRAAGAVHRTRTNGVSESSGPFWSSFFKERCPQRAEGSRGHPTQKKVVGIDRVSLLVALAMGE